MLKAATVVIKLSNAFVDRNTPQTVEDALLIAPMGVVRSLQERR